MIDPQRWILVEAWMANGLRLEWGSRGMVDKTVWQSDEEGHDYYYDGFGVFRVLPQGRDHWQVPQNEAPQLATATLRHELAHWLTSTDSERHKSNFGLTGNEKEDREREDKALAAEKVLSAVIASASRICTLALGGRSS